METDYVRTLLLVVDTGSMSEAARRLEITPAAVAHQLELLERARGARLDRELNLSAIVPEQSFHRRLDVVWPRDDRGFGQALGRRDQLGQPREEAPRGAVFPCRFFDHIEVSPWSERLSRPGMRPEVGQVGLRAANASSKRGARGVG